MSEVEMSTVAVGGEADQVKQPNDTKPSSPDTNTSQQEIPAAVQNGSDEPADTENTGTKTGNPRASEKSHKKTFNGRQVNNVKSKYDKLPESSDPDEIRRQVEFYLSDANLPMDAFLLAAIGGSENKPFPLKELAAFNRMKHFQPYSAIVAAVKQSKVLVVNEKEEVSRKVPLSDEYGTNTVDNRHLHLENSKPRIIYAKGFGDEESDTQTKVEAFFAPYGEVIAVRLRRHENKIFKGTATIEFADEKTASQFLELQDKPSWLNGNPLQFMPFKDWLKEKQEEGNGFADKYRPKYPSKDRKSSQKDYNSKSHSSGGKFKGYKGKNGDKDHYKGKNGDKDHHKGRDKNRTSSKRDREEDSDSDDLATNIERNNREANEEKASAAEEPEAKKIKITV